MHTDTLATRSATHNLQSGAYVLDLTVRRSRRAVLRLVGTSASLTRTMTITAWRNGVRHGVPVVRTGTTATTAIDDVVTIDDLSPGVWAFHVASSVADTAAVLTASLVAEEIATPVSHATAIGNPAARFCYGMNEGVGLWSDSYGPYSIDRANVQQATHAAGEGDWWRCSGTAEVFGYAHPFSQQGAWGGSPAVTSVAAGAAFPGNAGLLNRFPHAIDAFSLASNLADYTAFKTWNPVISSLIPDDPAGLLPLLTQVGSTITSAQLGFILHRTPDSITNIQHAVVNAAFGTASPTTYDCSYAHVAPYQSQLWTRTTAFGGAGASGFFPQTFSNDETGKKFFPLGAAFLRSDVSRGVVWCSGKTIGGGGVLQYAREPSAGGTYTDDQVDAYFAAHAAVKPVSLLMLHLGTNNAAMASGEYRRYLRQLIQRIIRIGQPYTPNPMGVILLTPMPWIDNTGADKTPEMAARTADTFAVQRELDLPDQISVVDTHSAIIAAEGPVTTWANDLLVNESSVYRLHVKPTSEARLAWGTAIKTGMLAAAGLTTDNASTIAQTLGTVRQSTSNSFAY